MHQLIDFWNMKSRKLNETLNPAQLAILSLHLSHAVVIVNPIVQIHYSFIINKALSSYLT